MPIPEMKLRIRSDLTPFSVRELFMALFQDTVSAAEKPTAPVHLWGAASLGRPVKSARWYLDGKKVASGLDAWIAAPPAGKHRLKLRAKGAKTVKSSFSVARR